MSWRMCPYMDGVECNTDLMKCDRCNSNPEYRKEREQMKEKREDLSKQMMWESILSNIPYFIGTSIFIILWIYLYSII